MKKQDTKAMMARVEMIESEAAKLRALIQEQEKPQGLWRPKPGDSYHIISAVHGLSKQAYCGDTNDEWRISQGNCFPTREAAEKAAPLFARAHKIIQAALLADREAGCRRIDREYVVRLDDDGKWIADRWGHAGMTAAHPVHVHTKAQAEHMAAILNAEGV